MTETRYGQAIVRLVRARALKRAAKLAWWNAAAAAGFCTGTDRRDDGARCYQQRKATALWCPSCQARSEPHAAYRAASAKAAGALRTVLALGRALASSEVEQP